MLARKALAGTAGAPKLYVEDVFSTYLYTGNGSSQTITNNIDLSGKGGLVWIKKRNAAESHVLTDTVRGAGNTLFSDTTAANELDTTRLSSFSSSGFSVGTSTRVNQNTHNYASWTFRKAEKFFDVVTYTGNGTAGRTIAHNLGSTPGFMVVKKTSASGDNWMAWHRSISGSYILLNTTGASVPSQQFVFGNDSIAIDPTSTVFTVASDGSVNANNATYVAYLFAHDAGGFGDAGSDSIIKCGSYTGNGGTQSITLDWEPQWLLIKRTTNADTNTYWAMEDVMRGGLTANGNVIQLRANTSGAEDALGGITTGPRATSTGFSFVSSTLGAYNSNGETYIYIAIRRGPMKTPETGTSVFNPVVYTGTAVDNRLIDTTIAPDMAMIRRRNSSTIDGMYVGNRLTGDEYLLTGTDAAGATDADSFMVPSASGTGTAFSAMNGVGVGVDATRQFNANTTSDNHVIHAFKRAPKFFDVVCYTGTGTTSSFNHNLGVTPDLQIVKNRDSVTDWFVSSKLLFPENSMRLNTTAGTSGLGSGGYDASSTTFTYGSNSLFNGSGSKYVAYLFASLTGISKVGSYTGNGSTTGPTVTTGFSPRYLLIKSISTSGEWVVYDTARGLGSGNEPTILLATASAEYSANYISPSSTGFQLVSNAGDINTNNQTYLYLAIA